MKNKRIYLTFLFLITTFLAGIAGILSATRVIYAGDEACTHPSYPQCYTTRVINEWACDTCGDYDWRCAGDTDQTCAGAGASCGAYGGPCMHLCIDTSYVGNCIPLDVDVPCNVSPGNCNWTRNIQRCVWIGDSCSEPSESRTNSCCGPGGGGAPTPTNTPGPPPPTPTPGGNSTPTCTLSGPYNLFTDEVGVYEAFCTDPEGRLDAIEIYSSPSGTQTWTLEEACNFGGVGSGTCTDNDLSFTTDGSYYVVVNGYDLDANRCSGNPWCEWSPNPPNTDNCSALGWDDCSLSDLIPVVVTAPSCEISLSSANLTSPGDTQTKIVTIVSETGGTIDRVDFGTTDASVVTASTPDLVGPPFQTVLTATGVGTAQYTATATMVDEGGIACTPNPANAAVDVDDPAAWWQIKEGSAVTNNRITSVIPATCIPPGCNPVFIDADAGNYPGVPSSDSSDFGNGTVSSTGWKAEPSQFASPRRQDFDYFEKRIPESASVFNIPVTTLPLGGVDITTFTSAYNGYHYFIYDGGNFGGSDLTITGDADIGSAKAILFVKNASVIFEGQVNLNDGQGFILVISDEDIIFDSGVGGAGADPHYEGLYVADGIIDTSSLGEDLDSQLRIRGSIVGLGNGWLAPGDQGVDLDRDLTDDTIQPAERIQYAPDQALLFPPELAGRRVQWREVAP